MVCPKCKCDKIVSNKVVGASPAAGGYLRTHGHPIIGILTSAGNAAIALRNFMADKWKCSACNHTFNA